MRRRDFLVGAASAPAFASTAAAQIGPLVLPASARPGSVLRGRAPAGATITIGSLVPPFQTDATGDFAIGLSRNAPASVRVTSSAVGEHPAGEAVLSVSRRRYSDVTITGTGRSVSVGGDPGSAVAPNDLFGMFPGEDLFDGGDPEIPQDPSQRSAVVSPNQAVRESRAEQIARELVLKRAAFASNLPLSGYLEQFRLPVLGRTTSEWGAMRTIVTAAGETRPPTPHCGVDIRGATGTSIVAPASGVVVLAHPDFYYEGGVVFIDHGQGLITIYLHMSAVDVPAGKAVVQGERIGAIGRQGRATGPHLCWRMKWRGRVDVDPMTLIAAAP